MIFVVVRCGDCYNHPFAVEKSDCQFYDSLDSKISEFRCPSCGNQLWINDTSFLGEFEYPVE